jgi:DNA-cytosine methyltransferase
MGSDTSDAEPMRYLSLFSGIGGFELGIKNAYVDVSASERNEQGGVDIQKGSADDKREPMGAQQSCVGFSEVDKYAIEIYQRHFPNHKNYGDITKIDERELPDFDLLIGGFPCQSFSVAGKRGGFGDTRGTLFFDIARIVREKQPRILCLENVKGLLSHDEGRTFATIIGTLDELGYDLQWQVLNSKNHGVPQSRERIYIVGNLRGTARPKVFPFWEGNRGIEEARDPSRKEVANTLRAKLGGPDLENSYNIDGTIRKLTPLECERLQGFPDQWTEGVSNTQRYKMLGNAVTVNVIRDIMIRVIKTT